MTKKNIYQAMFLLDNEEVRKGFNQAKDWIQSCLEKHNIEVKVLRLWSERPLAYSIGGRKRATYLLGWLEASGEAVNNAKREMYLVGPAFRVMFLKEEAIPADELVFGIESIKDSDIEIPDDVEETELVSDAEEVDSEEVDENFAPEEAEHLEASDSNDGE